MDRENPPTQGSPEPGLEAALPSKEPESQIQAAASSGHAPKQPTGPHQRSNWSSKIANESEHPSGRESVAHKCWRWGKGKAKVSEKRKEESEDIEQNPPSPPPDSPLLPLPLIEFTDINWGSDLQPEGEDNRDSMSQPRSPKSPSPRPPCLPLSSNPVEPDFEPPQPSRDSTEHPPEK